MIEEKLNSELIYDGKIIKLRRDTVKLCDGSTAYREEVEHPGGACVLALDEGKAVFVSQYRYAYGEELLELPAGKLEPQEDPTLAARRELEEETGLIANRLIKICEMKPSPGYTNEVIHVYYAPEVKKSKQRLDDGEFLSVVRISPERAFEMVERGEITDGKTLVALYYLKDRLAR